VPYVVERLCSKHKVLSSNPSTANQKRKKKRKEKQKEGRRREGRNYFFYME
jgi:hypothetical protein